MTEHTHKQFDAEMEAIRSGVLAMGGLVEKQLDRALAALADEEVADLIDVVGADEQAVNRMQMEIDQQCTQIIAKRQPAAIDLRPGTDAQALSEDDPRVAFRKRGTLTEIAEDLRTRLAPILDDVKQLTGTARARRADLD